MKTIKHIVVVAVILIANCIQAQTKGSLKGTITDEKGHAMPFASIAVLEDSTIVTGATTDDNGDYTIRELESGMYTIRVSFVAYKTSKMTNLEISPNQMSYANMQMVPNNMLGPIEVYAAWEKPLIDPHGSTVTNITFDQIENMAVEKGDIISMIVNTTPGVMATEDGSDLYVRGSRSGSTAYYIDGMRIMGSPEVPGCGISGMEVYTGGMPAEYGDSTGGVVIITTKEYQWEMRKKEIKKRAREEAKVIKE